MSKKCQKALSESMDMKTLDGMRQYPEGVYMTSLAFRIGAGTSGTHARLARLARSGDVVRVPDPSHGQPKRARWCLPEFADATRKAVDAAREASTRSKYGQNATGIGVFPTKAKPVYLDSYGNEYTPAPADMRFRVEQPEPFFSAPGYRTDMLKTGTAVARRYGEAA